MLQLSSNELKRWEIKLRGKKIYNKLSTGICLLVEVGFYRSQTSLQLDVSWQCSPGDPETPPMTAQILDTPEEVQTLPLPSP